MIQQVLINLLSNAIKFTNHGNVTLKATTNEKELFFQIEDTGIGIPKHQFDNIFKAFTQVKKEAGLSTQGTGLGLSITRQLVFLMSGEIKVDSEPGVGTCFSVRIPLPDPVVSKYPSPQKPGVQVENKTMAIEENQILWELKNLAPKIIVENRGQFLILIKELEKINGLFNPKGLECISEMIQKDFPEEIADKLIKPIEMTLMDFDDQRISQLIYQLRELCYE